MVRKTGRLQPETPSLINGLIIAATSMFFRKSKISVKIIDLRIGGCQEILKGF
jgi:hypothetical protein